MVVLGALAGCSSAATSAQVGGRTLLMYQSSGASGDAVVTGVLGSDAAGCVTVGAGTVLVAPPGSTLDTDGSIVVGSVTYSAGKQARFGGGLGSAPSGAHCSPSSKYWYL